MGLSFPEVKSEDYDSIFRPSNFQERATEDANCRHRGVWRGWAYPSVYIQIPGYMSWVHISKPKELLQVVMGGDLALLPEESTILY